MKVKVGEHTFDSTKEPIMIVFEGSDKRDMDTSMKLGADKFVAYPKSYDVAGIRAWVEERKNENQEAVDKHSD